MKLKDRIPWKILLAQSALIVSSILIAFAVDAWWAERLNTVTEREHLLALQRDFKIAEDRAANSLLEAEQTESELFKLFMAIERRTTEKLGRSAITAMMNAVRYEVFSSPRGAYDAMVNAGEVKLLQGIALKRSLADFYGGFEDMRVSERQLLRAVLAFQISDVFAQKINWADLGYSALNPDAPIGDRLKKLISSWSGDVLIRNWLGVIMAHQGAVAEDYRFLTERIEQILMNLRDELDRD